MRWRENRLQALGGLLWLIACAHAAFAGAPKLIRTLDLNSEFCDVKWQQLNVPREGMAFITEDQLLVYTICRDNVALSIRDHFQASNPFHLKAVIVDISTGAIRKHFDLPTHGYGSGIQVTHDGNLLIHRDNVLDLTDTEGKFLTGSRVSRTGLYDFITVATSPTEDLLSLVDFPDAPGTPNGTAVIDSRNLKVLHQWHDDADVGNIASSTTMTVRTAVHGSSLLTRAFGQSAWTNVLLGPMGGIYSPIFLTDSEYAVLDGAQSAVLVFKPFGMIAAKLKVWSPMALNVSRDGQIFGVAWGSMRRFNQATGGLEAGNTGVDLYDATSLQKIGSIDIHPTPYFDFVIAISPHGSKLAIIDSMKVSILEVPHH
ncbi:MAG TPA: hypothetical protein VH079_07430 [Terriglobales bacterium]|nr:hypothetical protein [Terriglobales bacterium]